MIRISITLHGRSDKRMEILQTLRGIKEQLNEKAKCRQAKIYQDIDDESTFFLVEDWVSEDDLDEYLSSRLFKVLLGINPIMEEPLEVKVLAYLWAVWSCYERVIMSQKSGEAVKPLFCYSTIPVHTEQQTCKLPACALLQVLLYCDYLLHVPFRAQLLIGDSIVAQVWLLRSRVSTDPKRKDQKINLVPRY